MAGLGDWPCEAHGSRVLSSSMYEAMFWQSDTNTHICQCGEARCVHVCVCACVRACVCVCVCVYCKMTAHINHQTAQQYKGATAFQDRQMGHSQPQQSSTCLICSGSISM